MERLTHARMVPLDVNRTNVKNDKINAFFPTFSGISRVILKDLRITPKKLPFPIDAPKNKLQFSELK